MKPAKPFAGKSDIHYRLEGNVLYLSNRLTIAEAEKVSIAMLQEFKGLRMSELLIDISGLGYIDSAGVMTLFYIEKTLTARGIKTVMRGGSARVQEKMELFSPDTLAEVTIPRKSGIFETTGKLVYEFLAVYLMGFLILAANMCYWAIKDLFRKKIRRKGEVVNQAVLIGVNAVLIVVFLTFVIGFVMALQSAGQLRSFGANIFVVDLVVIAIMSQMGPMITAVLVAGRSGSSIAAEIATMKVTSELDALKTMGLNPVRFVVVPKLYACLLTMPFLIVLSNVAGISGGALAANMYLDITPEIFINRMGEVISNKHLYTGFVKSQVYAIIVVLTGSFYGFRVVRGAEGVGKVTTVAVVVAITLVILADSIMGLIFY
jgi:phospholipid/cholesterol/gamma-HCH transport system permease protein